MNTPKIVASVNGSEPRCVAAVTRSDRRRAMSRIQSYAVSASPSAGLANCSSRTSVRCQCMIAPVSRMTPVSSSGTLNPCHSARYESSAEVGKASERYGRITAS